MPFTFFREQFTITAGEKAFRYYMSEAITVDLLVAVKNGDHSAFEQLFVANFTKVKYFIRGFVKSEDDAEELAQEVFVKMWVNREAIDVEKNFSTYLYVSARNATLNFLKKRDVRQSFVEDQMHQEVDTESTEETYFAGEVELLIKMTVANMPERRRAIFNLSRNKGLSNDEIAESLNISKKTVENQLSLIVKELREAVKFFI